MGRALRLSSLGAAGACLAASLWSCAGGDDAPRVAIVTRLTAPRALLSRASTLDLRVLEGGDVSCDDGTGALANETAAREIAKQQLGDAGCAAGVRFCGNVTIEKSDALRVFAAQAKDGSGTVLAVGCAAAKVDQDTVPISIQMFRYLEPAVCGDGTVQPTEQCETPGTAICDDGCQSNEVLLSLGNAQNGTDTGGPGDKTDPFLLWPSGSGTTGRLLAFFTDKKTGASNNTDVGVRAMADDLTALASPPALAKGSIFLSSGAEFPPQPAPLRQSMPQAAFLGGKYWVVFQDDNSPGSSGLDIHMRSLDDVLQSDQGADPLYVNGASGEPGIQAAPSIAAGKSRLFVAWEDRGAGKISGRTLTPPQTFGSQNDISTGNANTSPSVAATSAGFVTVWKSGTGIRLRAINDDGTPQGTEAPVSEGGSDFDRPRVASLPDGRFAVAWAAGGDVFVQRFDDKGAKVAGDQARPINDQVTDGVQTSVAIAATPAAGGSYVVAWVDEASGHVRARFLGGDGGFLFNNVNGQSTEFQASRVDGRTRANAAVAAGGSGPYVVIGWEDQGAEPNAGIVARRFPLPTE